jgi:hypothetical protein
MAKDRVTIFAGGSAPVTGITEADPQLSFALSATAVIAHNTMAAADSGNIPFQIPHFGVAIFFGYRSDLNAARKSVTKGSGCSQAAKWVPLSCLLKKMSLAYAFSAQLFGAW